MAAWKIGPFAAEVRRELPPPRPWEEVVELLSAFWRLGTGILRLGWWLIGWPPARPLRPPLARLPFLPLQSPFPGRWNAYGDNRPESAWRARP